MRTYRRRHKMVLPPNCFHTAMKFPIQLAQYFSFFPIDINIKDNTLHLIKFKWFHWRVAYALVTFLLYIFEFLTLLKQQIQLDPAKKNIMMFNGFVFHVGGLLQFILVFKMSMEWPYLIKTWYKVECIMKNYKCHQNLTIQLMRITVFIMSLALAEHVLVNAYKLKDSFEIKHSTYEAFRNYFTYSSYSHVFDVIEYSLWKGMIFQVVNLQRTFNWNYVDIFLMLIGSALKFRLKLITRRIKYLIRFKVVDIDAWRTIRKDYVTCAQLCLVVNDKISYIILVSYSLNLYFVLFQLFGIFRPFENSIQKLYFYISFGLVLLRLVCICFFGGEVNVEWKNIGFALNSVRSSAYNLEVERLINYIASCEVVLSGKNCFRITRGLMLKIAEAVVTYELILLQFIPDKIKNANA